MELLDHEWYEQEYQSGVRGTAKNVSDETVSYVQVEVYYLDSEGTRIGEGLANASDLKAGRKWQFETIYMGDEEVTDYEIEIGTSL